MFVASFVLLSNCFLPNPHGDLLYDSSPLSDWLGTSITQLRLRMEAESGTPRAGGLVTVNGLVSSIIVEADDTGHNQS